MKRLEHTYLEEPLEPPHLEYPLPNQNTQLEDTPPFHPPVRAFCRVPVYAFADNDVALLVFDLVEKVEKFFHCREGNVSTALLV